MNLVTSHAAAPPSGDALLDIRGLSIRLPAGADRPLAVKDASLRIGRGETLCIVGESGSGKSMIANAVMGLLPQPMVAPVAGAILFQGHDLLALAEPQWRALRGNRIGMIFQDPMSALNPVMRIGDQLEGRWTRTCACRPPTSAPASWARCATCGCRIPRASPPAIPDACPAASASAS